MRSRQFDPDFGLQSRLLTQVVGTFYYEVIMSDEVLDKLNKCKKLVQYIDSKDRRKDLSSLVDMGLEIHSAFITQGKPIPSSMNSGATALLETIELEYNQVKYKQFTLN